MSNNRSTFWKTRWTALLIAVVAAFVFSQFLTSVHASKYGDGPHKHDGQVCVLSFVTHSADKVIPTSAFVFVMALTIWRAADQITQTEHALVAIRAARPRGPPAQ